MQSLSLLQKTSIILMQSNAVVAKHKAGRRVVLKSTNRF